MGYAIHQKNKSAHCRSVSRALSFVLFYTLSDVWLGPGIPLIRDQARGTLQLYLRVAWTSAVKQFFVSQSFIQNRRLGYCILVKSSWWSVINAAF